MNNISMIVGVEVGVLLSLIGSITDVYGFSTLADKCIPSAGPALARSCQAQETWPQRALQRPQWGPPAFA